MGLSSEEHLQVSCQALTADEAERAGEKIINKFLPVPCMSTLATVLMLCRGAGRVPRTGGFTKCANKEAAAELIKYIVQATGEMNKLGSVSIALDDRWQASWLLAPPSNAPALNFLVDDQYMLDLQELASSQHKLGKRWWRLLCQDPKLGVQVQTRRRASLPDMLRILGASDQYRAFFAQLLWSISLQVEAALEQAFQRQHEKDEGGFTMVAVDIESSLTGPASQLNFELLRYTLAAKDASAAFNYASVALDKGNVNGLQLMGSSIVLADNTAIVGVPQVPRLNTCSTPAQARAKTPPKIRKMRRIGVYFFLRVLCLNKVYTNTRLSYWCIFCLCFLGFVV